MVFRAGVGLPGRVWATGQAAWIEDVVHDSNFPARASRARRRRAWRVRLSRSAWTKNVLGVIECFNRTVMTPDLDLLRTMSTVGSQIEQFMGRKREEAAVAEGASPDVGDPRNRSRCGDRHGSSRHHHRVQPGRGPNLWILARRSARPRAGRPASFRLACAASTATGSPDISRPALAVHGSPRGDRGRFTRMATSFPWKWPSRE